MKKLVLVSFVFLVSICFFGFVPKKNKIVNQSEFCKGFEDGFCEGYKDIKGAYANCPVTPICPIPEVGKDNYKGGYNTGFKTGMRKAYDN
jgi:hypothetical protein